MIGRRTLTQAMTTVAAGFGGVLAGGAPAAGAGRGETGGRNRGLGPVRHVRTPLLNIAYHEVGPADGTPVVLSHGWPFDPVGSYSKVAPALARHGYRRLVPYLRGHGETRFRHGDTLRSGQQGALGADHIAFLDALGIRRALYAGYDWGGRAANVAAALWTNPDYVDVVIHSYRHRLGAVPGDPRYDSIEARLAEQPPITVPTVTLDGQADGVTPWTDGTSSAPHFPGTRVHHVVPGAGHNLPQQRPDAFASAVREVDALS
ncbi:alpha/beta fold hydrolase [Streptomyces sp. NPDC057428]|uniref:alpha/beta fold hydrolase n=1 Tax=Streptomyces sp. NPDC057428 TaxID=3346129 RepID=UPI003685F277